MSVDEELSPQQRQHDYNFSGLQGLQVVGSAAGAGGDEGPENSLWREALRSELEARAARFRQAVDASLYSPMTELSAGSATRLRNWRPAPICCRPVRSYSPTPVCPRQLEKPSRRGSSCGWRRRPGDFLDLCLPCEAWRTVRLVRDLAAKISKLLGVLEREPMRSQIKALDQNSRAALRKHGVRFGAYYVYVPTVLKPASRALALQLWSLHMLQVDAEGLAKALIPMASSGRTSLAVDQLISTKAIALRASGQCRRARCAGLTSSSGLPTMIGAVSCWRSTSGGARSAGPVFIVSGQMTSLAGCSGETFASILRSLGFESSEIDRGELVLPRPAVEAQATSMSSSVARSPDDSPAKDGAQSPSVPTCDVLRGSGSRSGTGREEEEGFSAAASDSEEPNGETREEDFGKDRPAEFALASNAAEVPESAGNNTSSTDTTVTRGARPKTASGVESAAFSSVQERVSGSRSVNDPPGERFIGRGASDRGRSGREPSPGRIDSRPAGRRASSVACAWPFRKRSRRRKAPPDDAETEYLRRGREFGVATPGDRRPELPFRKTPGAAINP